MGVCGSSEQVDLTGSFEPKLPIEHGDGISRLFGGGIGDASGAGAFAAEAFHPGGLAGLARRMNSWLLEKNGW